MYSITGPARLFSIQKINAGQRTRRDGEREEGRGEEGVGGKRHAGLGLGCSGPEALLGCDLCSVSCLTIAG